MDVSHSSYLPLLSSGDKVPQVMQQLGPHRLWASVMSALFASQSVVLAKQSALFAKQSALFARQSALFASQSALNARQSVGTFYVKEMHIGYGILCQY